MSKAVGIDAGEFRVPSERRACSERCCPLAPIADVVVRVGPGARRRWLGRCHLHLDREVRPAPRGGGWEIQWRLGDDVRVRSGLTVLRLA